MTGFILKCVLTVSKHFFVFMLHLLLVWDGNNIWSNCVYNCIELYADIVFMSIGPSITQAVLRFIARS